MQGALARRLIESIRREGLIPVERFMGEAVAHYYSSRDPFGVAGDFTTAPEISQMFGEMIAVWAMTMWQALGSPTPFILAELGPGRGTLMADLLRGAKVMPAFLAAAEPWLVETSATLRAKQKQTLEGHRVRWAETFEALPPGPMLLVANEFFDALPIAQVVRRNGSWLERMIGVDGAGQFAFLDGAPVDPTGLTALPTGAPDGAIFEIGWEGARIAGEIGKRVATQGGAALIIDYGHAESAAGDTLQAVRNHAFHPVLDNPGEADLTAHVDFAALARAAQPAKAWGPVTQRDFLRNLGIELRAHALARGKEPAIAQQVRTQMHRLIDGAEMGTLFKVLTLAPPNLPPPPGLGPE